MSVMELIHAIPEVLSYYVPGYVFRLVFYLMTRSIDINKDGDETNKAIPCIVISYVITSGLKAIPMLNELDQAWFVLILIVASAVLGLIFSAIWKTRWMNRFTVKIARTTTYAHLWHAALNANKSHMVRFDTEYNHKKARVEGCVKSYEVIEDGKSRLMLDRFKIIYDDNTEYIAAKNEVIVCETPNMIEVFSWKKGK